MIQNVNFTVSFSGRQQLKDTLKPEKNVEDDGCCQKPTRRPLGPQSAPAPFHRTQQVDGNGPQRYKQQQAEGDGRTLHRAGNGSTNRIRAGRRVQGRHAPKTDAGQPGRENRPIDEAGQHE